VNATRVPSRNAAVPITDGPISCTIAAMQRLAATEAKLTAVSTEHEEMRGVLLYVIASLSTPANGNPDQIRSAKEVLLTYCDPRQLRDNMAVPRGLCSSQVEQQKKAAAGYLDEAVKTITANSVSVAA